jgi:membrane protein
VAATPRGRRCCTTGPGGCCPVVDLHEHRAARAQDGMTMSDQQATRLHAEPDDDKVDSPTKLDSRSWRYVLRRTLREFMSDECTDLAAALTYYAVLALFPAAIALTSLLGLVGQGDDAVEELLSIVRDLGGGSMVESIEAPLIALSQSQSAGLAMVLGLVGALWSASGYVGAFGRAMNRMYEIGEGRPIWKLRPFMLLLTLVLVVLAAAVLLALILTGSVAQSVGELLGLGSTGILVWQIAKWPVLLAVVVVIVALLYYATPNIRQPRFRWISVGAALAIVVWIVLSAAFGLYVANFSSYDKTYGALGGVIVFLLWLWLTNLALLFGAELDSELERGRELQSGLAAEETLQLPPRDTRKLKKDEAGEEKDIKLGREIRRSHAHRQGRRRKDKGDA